jgi:hypothetical protein
MENSSSPTLGQTSVAKSMAKRRDPPSQGWRTFLRNHADGIAAMDRFVVPTISFRLLYGLLIVGHGRRQILRFGVTAHPRRETVWLLLNYGGGRCLRVLGFRMTFFAIRLNTRST